MDFVEALKLAQQKFVDHPHWQMLDGTPWSNDAPVVAAELMCHAAAELERRVEQHRVQLAGCSVAACGGTKDTAKRGDYGWSVAYQDVLDLHLKYDALESRLERLQEEKAQLQTVADDVVKSWGIERDMNRQLEIRLAKAEAAARAMREALEQANDLIHRFRNDPAPENFAQEVDPVIRLCRAALSRLPGGEGGKA